MYISCKSSFFLVDPIVPQDFANCFTSEDLLCIPSSFGGA